MDDSFDIYGDLDEALITPLQEDICKKKAIEESQELEEKKLKDENEKILTKLSNENRQVKENIALLLGTAKCEIERKDQQIRALRKELDDLIFRKNKVTRRKTMEKFTQTAPMQIQQKFTQTIQVDNSSLYPVERRLSKDRREKSPRSLRDRCRKEEAPKKLSHRDDKYSQSRNKDKSPERSYRRDKSRRPATDQQNDKSSKERHSSNEKDSHRKSPRKDKHHRHDNMQNERKTSRDKDEQQVVELKKDKKVDDNDLRIKLLKKKRNVEIGEIKEDSEKIVVENIEDVSPPLPPADNVRIQFETDVNRFMDLKNNLVKSQAISEEKVIEPELNLIEAEQMPSNDIEEVKNMSEINETPLKDILIEEHVENLIVIQEVAVEEIAEAELTVEQVPLEVGPEYCFKQQPVEEVILELPMEHTEEIIYDSRDLNENKSPKNESTTNESFESTKENSLNNSLDKKSRKRKMVTTEVESDGTVVFTITRKKKRKTAKS